MTILESRQICVVHDFPVAECLGTANRIMTLVEEFGDVDGTPRDHTKTARRIAEILLNKVWQQPLHEAVTYHLNHYHA